ncbi:hypothetical protein E1A91_A06G198900v1 [Gossypium mustelinum]|uniref:Uncharacterized protein n=1 Tax=Gossypium mustelinum TaxID=34275 RepID=A0A5D2YYD1_GOSMU|nr:hypothetical protein E1A91_A06G198900v1 [Gossypium mustelinum]
MQPSNTIHSMADDVNNDQISPIGAVTTEIWYRVR